MNREKTLLTQMGVAIGMIVLCLAAMGFSAYAYFSHSISSGVNMITAANFSLEISYVSYAENVTEVSDGADAAGSAEGADAADVADSENVSDEAAGQPPVVLADDTFYCKKAGTYTFVLKHAGTAETGYCEIKIYQADANGDKIADTAKSYYTTQIFKPVDDTKGLTLSIEAAKGWTIEFIPQWGTSSYYSVNQEMLYGDGATISLTTNTEESGDGTEDVTLNGAESGTGTSTETEIETFAYIVQSGDTLSAIASKYNTTVDVLADLNGIANADNIEAGRSLLIPVSGEVKADGEAGSGETGAVTDVTEAVGVTEAVPDTTPTEGAETEPATASTESSSPAVE